MLLRAPEGICELMRTISRPLEACQEARTERGSSVSAASR